MPSVQHPPYKPPRGIISGGGYIPVSHTRSFTSSSSSSSSSTSSTHPIRPSTASILYKSPHTHTRTESERRSNRVHSWAREKEEALEEMIAQKKRAEAVSTALQQKRMGDGIAAQDSMTIMKYLLEATKSSQ